MSGGLTFGLAVPNYRPGASVEGIAAAAETAERLGWEAIWTTDHVLPDTTPRSREYGRLYEAVTTLAWLAARTSRVRLGTSVLVVPMRNAAVTAKELATVDDLSGGRLIAGVGVGWSETEYRHLGLGDRYHERGRYLDETIALWRHLWSGTSEPFRGRFHSVEDFAAEPLPAQRAAVPIWVGGRSEAAYRRAGRLGDAYQSSGIGPDEFSARAASVRAASAAAGRETPVLSARVRLAPDGGVRGGYALSGDREWLLAEVDRFAAAGASHLVIDFVDTDPAVHTRRFEAFHADVASVRMAR